jgi:anionic cell wall polymer biosynthesis LytR-Cps2A-Psr (LCP) family protein
MNYDDNWQNLHIHLEAGPQHLDGAHAIQYLRFRHDVTGDLARMHRQQAFLRSLASQITRPGNIPKLPWVMKELRKQVQTNMDDTDLLYLASELRGVPGKHLMFDTLPGESRSIGGEDYYLLYANKMREMIARTFPGAMPPDEGTVDSAN